MGASGVTVSLAGPIVMAVGLDVGILVDVEDAVGVAVGLSATSAVGVAVTLLAMILISA